MPEWWQVDGVEVLAPSYLVHGCVQVAQGQEGHVVLHGVHQGGNAELQQLLGAVEHMLHQRGLQPTSAA